MKRLILISASVIAGVSAYAQTGCVTAPVTVTTGSQVTLTTSGDKSVTNKETYIYYSRRHGKKRWEKYADIQGISDKHHSKPVMLSMDKTVTAVPETYNVSLTPSQSQAAICPDSTLNLTANVNLEKVSSYTGNYPASDNKVYEKVSRHHYKMAARKLRKVKKNEEKIARKTGVSVDARTEKI